MLTPVYNGVARRPFPLAWGFGVSCDGFLLSRWYGIRCIGIRSTLACSPCDSLFSGLFSAYHDGFHVSGVLTISGCQRRASFQGTLS
jgi:hypothetical protein